MNSGPNRPVAHLRRHLVANFVDFGKNLGEAFFGLPRLLADSMTFSSEYPALHSESVDLWIDALVASNNFLFSA